MRVAWLLLPLLAGPVLADALDDASRPVQVVASTGLWAAWASVLVATMMPRTVSLTALRIVAPAAGIAVLAAVAVGHESVPWRLGGSVIVLVAVGMAFAPSTSHAFLNGSAYGDEQRFALRIPGPLLLGVVQGVWAVVVAGAVAGPLLLAAKQWVVGALVLVVGCAAVSWGTRVLHTLARRWVVLVPAGMVLHDQLALRDPVLLRRGEVVAFGPAPAGSDALDLSRGALGLAVEVHLKDQVPLGVLADRRGRPAATVDADRLLLTPTRPGALLTAAHSRRIG
ncbi:MAG: hypothetical protein ACRD2C_16765 [Acidimicrobiales bacterium]